VLKVREVEGKAVQARYAKPDEVSAAAAGKMWLPREKSQRVMGRAREAGWDFMMGTSKSERVAMPPLARRAVLMLKSWRAWVEDMLMGFWVNLVEMVMWCCLGYI
jgi:hypothetical protein